MMKSIRHSGEIMKRLLFKVLLTECIISEEFLRIFYSSLDHEFAFPPRPHTSMLTGLVHTLYFSLLGNIFCLFLYTHSLLLSDLPVRSVCNLAIHSHDFFRLVKMYFVYEYHYLLPFALIFIGFVSS